MVPSEFVLVLTTLPRTADPASFARTLVQERLVACVNIMPAMRSVYRWKGDTEEDEEHQILMKTLGARLPALWVRVRELHPYDVPEFIALPVVHGSDGYLQWVRESSGPAQGAPSDERSRR